MKKEVLLFFILFLLLPITSAQVVINEVMPHSNNDWNDEWIELYNPTNNSISLDNWKIGDKKSNDTFNLVINPFSFVLIVDSNTNHNNLTSCECFNISNLSCVELLEIGKGLNDDNETVFLYNNNNSILIDFFSWNINIKNSGKSWARNETNFWTTCNPTPGQENYCLEEHEPEPEPELEPEEEESNLEIINAPEEAVFGDIIDVKLNVYRGNTGKYAIYVRVEDDNEKDVSEEAVLHVFTKYIEYKIKIPVQLKLNCNDKYDEDEYIIIVEGLDERVSQEIKISGKSSLCENNKGDKNDKQTIEDIEENSSIEAESSKEMITGNTIKIIENEATTVLKMTPYLLSLLCLFIAFYIIKIK